MLSQESPVVGSNDPYGSLPTHSMILWERHRTTLAVDPSFKIGTLPCRSSTSNSPLVYS